MSEGLSTLLDQVDTSAKYPLGTTFTQAPGDGAIRDPAVTGSFADRGIREWIYVKNSAGAALAQGEVCTRKSGSTLYEVSKAPTTSHPAQVVGVAQWAIADGSYGWILRKGLGEVKADSATVITADKALVPGTGTAGRAQQHAAVTNAGFGFSTETVLVDALATCHLNCTG